MANQRALEVERPALRRDRPGLAVGSSSLLLAVAMACASGPPPGQRAVVLSSPDVTRAERAPSAAGPTGETGAVSLPFRGPGVQGTYYRLTMEMSGERLTDDPIATEPREPLNESHDLELEYRERTLGGEGGDQRAYSLDLIALHFHLRQRGPQADNEVEIASDRIRTLANAEVQLDLRGSPPRSELAPRKLIGSSFGVVLHDATGEPISAIRPHGPGAARRFLRGLNLHRSVAYTRIPLPVEPVAAGFRWHAKRSPVSTAGALGLELDVEYLLAGFEELDGVPCAFLVIHAELRDKDIPSRVGFEFKTVDAELRGQAWVELATSRVRLLTLEDDVRATYRRTVATENAPTYSSRHKTRIRLELHQPDKHAKTWGDGSKRFGPR